MAVSKQSFTSVEDFVAWFQETLVPIYFGAADFEDSTLTAYADAEKTILLVSESFGWTPEIKVYKSSSVYATVTGKSEYSTVYPKNAYISDNGVFIDFTGNNLTWLVTKNNNDATMICIAGSDSITDYCKSTYCIVYGDDVASTNPITFTPKTLNQLCLVPFYSDAEFGSMSYAEKAYYIPCGSYYTLGYGIFQANNKKYLTNGYWAVEIT